MTIQINARTPLAMPRRLPTKDELVRMYRSMADSAHQNHTAERIDGPPVKDPNKYPHYDITPDGLMDVGMTVYVIQGQLYERVSSMMGPNGMTSEWFKIGRDPIF